jgi:hypothetical protein
MAAPHDAAGDEAGRAASPWAPVVALPRAALQPQPAAPQVAALEHPFIVPHIDSWIHATHTVKIVYGYCEQGDLSDFVKKLKKKVGVQAHCRAAAAPAPPAPPVPLWAQQPPAHWAHWARRH